MACPDQTDLTSTCSYAVAMSVSAFGVEHGGEVSKFGDWKTIEQRDESRRSARRVKRRSLEGAGAGAAIAGYGFKRSGIDPVNFAGYLDGARKTSGVSGAAKLGTKRLVATGAHGKLALAGSGIGAAGLAAAGGAQGVQSYHQAKINQRRKDNLRRQKVVKSLLEIEKGLPSAMRESMASGNKMGKYAMKRIDAHKQGKISSAHVAAFKAKKLIAEGNPTASNVRSAVYDGVNANHRARLGGTARNAARGMLE